jgi:hypothetical protein
VHVHPTLSSQRFREGVAPPASLVVVPDAPSWRHGERIVPIFVDRGAPFFAIYDVSGATVEVLAIVTKSEAESWLAQFGNPE